MKKRLRAYTVFFISTFYSYFPFIFLSNKKQTKPLKTFFFKVMKTTNTNSFKIRLEKFPNVQLLKFIHAGTVVGRVKR